MAERGAHSVSVRGRNWFHGLIYIVFGVLLFVPILAVPGLPAISASVATAPSGSLFALVLVLVSVLALGMMAYGIHVLLYRTLVVDEAGAKLFRGTRELWNEAWGDVATVGVTSPTGGGRFTTVFVKSKNRERRLTHGENFGPIPQVEAAFRALVEFAPPGVVIMDGLGWADELRERRSKGAPSTAILGPDFMSKWHPSEGFKREWREGRLVVATLILSPPAAGIWYALSGRPAVDVAIFFGLMALIFWGMLAWVFLWTRRDTPLAVRFDASGVSLEFPRKRIVEAPWAAVTKCERYLAGEPVVIAMRPSDGERTVHCLLYVADDVRQALLSTFNAMRSWKVG